MSALFKCTGTFLFLECMMVVLLFINIFWVLYFHEGKFRERLPFLIAAIGSKLMALFISISSSLAPFQCDLQRNCFSKVQAYGQTVCLSGNDHKDIVFVFFHRAVRVGCCSCLGGCGGGEGREREGHNVPSCLWFLVFSIQSWGFLYVVVELLRNLGAVVISIFRKRRNFLSLHLSHPSSFVRPFHRSCQHDGPCDQHRVCVRPLSRCHACRRRQWKTHRLDSHCAFRCPWFPLDDECAEVLVQHAGAEGNTLPPENVAKRNTINLELISRLQMGICRLVKLIDCVRTCNCDCEILATRLTIFALRTI